ncbi:cache domain-containing protein, partial [Candidatus Woesearchaeota archaeon]|nr:cache domain-containing protein [Candidatus Woesearchaeota archaeon]
DGIKDRLQNQAEDWRLIVKTYNTEIDAQETRVRNSAKNIVAAQAKMTYELIDEALEENGGNLPLESKEDIFNRINRNTVGATGYTWILDYNGVYVLSKGRQRDGENVWETQDSDGNMVIQDLIRIGKEVRGSEIAYHSYPWLNIGETEPREKIAAMIHFPELKWIVGISTYYDDLVDMGYRSRSIEHVKDLMAKQLIGRSGYIWVVNSTGHYIVSKNRLRDGEDISMSEDANGVLFIQEAVKKAKEAGSGTAVQEYPWLNKGETKARMKVAGLAYVEEWDWIIGPSAYYDDFAGEGALGMVARTLWIVGIIATIAAVLVAFIFANRISSPLKKMAAAGDKIANGDINAEVPAVHTGDEVEDIGNTMTLLTGAVKYHLKNAKEKKKP